MELNRKDYRKYVSKDCRKCAFYNDNNYETLCDLTNLQIFRDEWKCWTDKFPFIPYIFKLIKK